MFLDTLYDDDSTIFPCTWHSLEAWKREVTRSLGCGGSECGWSDLRCCYSAPGRGWTQLSFFNSTSCFDFFQESRRCSRSINGLTSNGVVSEISDLVTSDSPVADYKLFVGYYRLLRELCRLAGKILVINPKSCLTRDSMFP